MSEHLQLTPPPRIAAVPAAANPVSADAAGGIVKPVPDMAP